MKPQQFGTITGNRRNFLKSATLTGAGLTTVALLGNKMTSPSKVDAATTYTDIEILNFALNLEYLEAEFYAVSTYGATLVQLGVLTEAETTGPTTGGTMVSGFGSSPYAFVATGLRDDEIHHVQYLRQVLGSNAVKKPAINLAALGRGFANVDQWLGVARELEENGMSAYLGATPLIQSSTYLAAAGAILLTEGQHSGALRFGVIKAGTTSPAIDSHDVPPATSAPFHVNSNGLSVPRTFSQVLNVVYAGGSCSGGFFPNGLNGSIVCQGQ